MRQEGDGGEGGEEGEVGDGVGTYMYSFDGSYQAAKTWLSGAAAGCQLAGIYVAPDAANLV